MLFRSDGLLQPALTRLEAALAEQILVDGGHASRSPSVHLAVLRDLIEIRQALRLARIGQPAADLETVLGIDGARALDRNQLLASVLAELNVTLLEFERTGFDAFRSDWQRRHVHQDCPVKLTLSGGASVSGLARGVREDGALLLETAQGIKPFHSGDVSLRSAGRAPVHGAGQAA